MQITVTRHGRPAPHAGARGAARAGFTIPELLVVLVLISLLAYITVPAIEIVRFQMDGAARGAVAAMVSAQRLAVKRQHDVVVAFDTAGARLRIHQDRDNDGVLDTDEPIRMVSFDDGVAFGTGEAPRMTGDDATITFSETQDELPVVRFLRNGSASEEGTFYLRSRRSDGASESSSGARAVRVDRATGRVTWYRYDAPDWVESF